MASQLVLTEHRKLQIAYYIMMYYAMTSIKPLTDLKAKVEKILVRRDIRADRPDVEDGGWRQFAVRLIANTASYGLGEDLSSFDDQDMLMAYALLKSHLATEKKEPYDLRRDLPHVRTGLKQHLGIDVPQWELQEFVVLLYGDTIRFVFQGQQPKTD